VTARDIRTSEAQSVQVKPSHGLTDDEVEGMIRESFQFAEEDIKARQVIEARTEANAIIVATDKALARASDLISEKEKAEIQRVIHELGETRKGDDHRVIRAGIAEDRGSRKGDASSGRSVDGCDLERSSGK
jgi:molecular chaperone DnaK (HSP70)